MNATADDPILTQTHKGLTVRHRGEYVEAVSTKAADVRLLTAHSEVEVVEVSLKKGMRLTLTLAGGVVETYYVLSGRLSCALPSGPRILKEGDYMITQALEEPAILSALTPVRLLYVTSRPQFHEISEHLSQLRELAVEVESKDGYTADHCDRLQALSYATGQELGLSTSRLRLLDYGAYLHDVGKLSVPLAILQKPSALDPDEWSVVKQHPTFGRELLDKTFMKEAGAIVEQHHERLDGSGYPYGLSSSELLVEAAIVAVADTYDAMTTDRPYRRALSQEEAFEEIHKYSGVHYPKDVVKAFFSSIKRLEKSK